MPWVKLDENFSEHPKMKEATPLGMAMQVAALCYCNRYLTDGFVRDSVVEHLLDLECTIEDEKTKADGEGPIVYTIKMFAGRGPFRQDMKITCKYLAELLVACDVWEKREGGYQIHDYCDFQPTREMVEKDKEEAKVRMRELRAKR